jgi:hypothetical protein
MSLGQLLAALSVAAPSLLLGLAGWAKLRRPGPATLAFQTAGIPFAGLAVRVLATLELVVAVAGLGLRGRLGGALVAGAFVLLAAGAAGFSRKLERHPCGCFGDLDGLPIGRRQVAINLAAALLAAGGARLSPDSLAAAGAGDAPLRLGLLLAALALALAAREWLRGRGKAALDATSVRLVASSARVLEARFSRRSALVRLAVAGSALCIAPLRYLLYPGTALAVVVPGDCGGGLCTDGYTAFCCEINQGVNGCPEGTFPGGWWMCTDYTGTQLCAGTGMRYYVDCNALPGRQFPGGCRCANDSCAYRRVACNIFRYGQCNTQVPGTTAVVCRMVVCENPGLISALNCSTAVMVDDAVCAHEAGCLEPMAVQLPGAGGA